MLSGLGSQGRCMELSMLTKKEIVSVRYIHGRMPEEVLRWGSDSFNRRNRERCQIHAASGYGLVTHIYNIGIIWFRIRR